MWLQQPFWRVIAIGIVSVITGCGSGDIDESKYQPTPTSLKKLLGDAAETDSLDIRYALTFVIKDPFDSKDYYDDNRLVVENGQLLIYGHSGFYREDHLDRFRAKDLLTYSLDGGLVSYWERYYSFHDLNETIGKHTSEGFELVRQVIKTDEGSGFPVGADTIQREIISSELPEETLPYKWYPLVVAYHLREGNQSFRCRFCFWREPESAVNAYFDVIGTEMIQVDGEEVLATIVKIESRFDPGENYDGDQTAEDVDGVSISYFAADGRELLQETQNNAVFSDYTYATPEQIAEQFGLRLESGSLDPQAIEPSNKN